MATPWWQTVGFGHSKPVIRPGRIPTPAPNPWGGPWGPRPEPHAISSQPQFRPFRPYQPPPPPAGSYDPALDAQLGAARRGYEDLQQDTSTADLRAGVDYGLDRGDIERTSARSLADLDLGHGRGLTDLGTARTRGMEDYGQQIAMLNRSYQQLARRQAEGARVSGVLSGGLALQSAAKRAENQAIERQPLDTSYSRFMSDNDLARGRLDQDWTTQRGRVGEDTDQAYGRLALGYERGGQDRTTQLARAGRENTQFGLDVNSQELYQAAQSGYVAPGKGQKGGMPKNEGVTARGTPYREQRQGGYIYRYDRTGKLISKRKA